MAIVFYSTIDSGPRWGIEMARLMPEREFRVWPDVGDPAAVDYALVWRPPPELLSSLPNLKLILSLGAGVDHLLHNPGLPPGVPVARLVDPYLTDAMSEYVALQVLRLHRRDLDYQEQQRRTEWREHPQKNAGERQVGILGCGVIGYDAARKLRTLGFDIAGWARRGRDAPEFPIYAGAAGLDSLLARSEILVCLLPLTAETEGILNAGTFARLPRGAGLVNAGRGRHLIEEDLIPALESGQLSAAALDVFREEPLPSEHPFWRHPRILVTPHIAGSTNPTTAAMVVCDAIGCLEEGRPVPNLVNRTRGY